MDNLQPLSKLLNSYLVKPNIKFSSQKDSEEVILLLRAHPLTQILWVTNGIIFFLLLVLTNFLIPSFFNPLQIIFFNFFFFFLILGYLWFNFINWYFNVGIISNEQIVDVDFFIVLYKQITTANLNKVQDITIKAGGFFESFFNYGNIFVQTAGAEVNIEFINIPDPAAVTKIIDELIDQAPK